MSKSAKLRRPSAKMKRQKCGNATSPSHEIKFFSFYLIYLKIYQSIYMQIGKHACMYMCINQKIEYGILCVCGDKILYRTTVLKDYNSKKKCTVNCILLEIFPNLLHFSSFLLCFIYSFSLLFSFCLVFTGHRVWIKLMYIIFLLKMIKIFSESEFNIAWQGY